MTVGFNAVTLGPIIKLGGSVQIGKDPNPIAIKVIGGVDTSIAGKFYFYASVKNLDFDKILKAYSLQSTLLTAIRDIQFKEVSVGVSFPTDTKDENGVMVVPSGFSFY